MSLVEDRILNLLRVFAALAACCTPAVGAAAFIESAPVTVRSLSDPLAFDFSSSNLGHPVGPEVTGVEFVWKATPGPGSAPAHLSAGVAVPDFALGKRFEGALETTTPANGAPVVAAPTTFAPTDGSTGLGLPEDFLSGHTPVVDAVLFTSGTGAQDLGNFFAEGGTLEASMRIETPGVGVPAPAGPGGGAVPEPASLAVWGFVAVLAVSRRLSRSAIARSDSTTALLYSDFVGRSAANLEPTLRVN